MSHLVSDYHSETSEVRVVIRIDIKERCVHYRYGDRDVIKGRLITCIERLHLHRGLSPRELVSELCDHLILVMPYIAYVVLIVVASFYIRIL